MPKEILPTVISTLTILNNINDLIVESSNREEAKDVMRAMVVYARSQQVTLPLNKINDFYVILLDSKPYTLTSLIMDIAQDVMALNRK